VRAQLLVAILLLALVPVASGVDGRAMTAEVVMNEHLWTSADAVTAEVFVSGAPYNRDITLTWELSDENGTLLTGSEIFQMGGSTHIVQLSLSAFYAGGMFHDLEIEVSLDSTIITDHVAFTVLRNSLLPAASNLIVFGDSLSDMGNAKDSIVNVPDVPPYWAGRFSNGPVWIEHVSAAYGLNTTRGSGTDQGDNRAFGGSQTGQFYSYIFLPNAGTQINNYLANVQSNLTSSDVVFLWAGGNDFLYGTANPDTISQNMASHIRTLALAGGSRFVVANLPPLEVTPEGASRSAQQRATLASDVITYNVKLEQEMTNLSNSMSIDITLIDAWTVFNDIVNNADHVGIINTQDQACITSGTLLPLPICNSGDTVVSNPNEYLFFDKAHPTATMHKVIGAYAVMNIGHADTDGDGIIDDFDQCEWTTDLSTVNVDGCDWYQQDADSDGVTNGDDDCPDTEIGSVVDESGCADYQRDTDGDGLTDDVDPCPEDVVGEDHDSDGCIDLVDADDDNDGILDENDLCPRGELGIHEFDFDSDGCSDNEDSDDDQDGLSDADEAEVGSNPFDNDTDDDGVWDGQDAFPTDPTEYQDSDGDGVGDNSDDFPYDSSEWQDSDNDEVGDNADVFPDDVSEWEDSDNDGVGDNSDECPFESGTSWYPAGCPDADGDYWGDDVDAFPHNNEEWLDSDGDGVGDNSDVFPMDSEDWADSDGDNWGDNRDAFPSDQTEWNDTDGDGCGDNSDAFPLDGTECFDSDLDGVGDNADPWPQDPNEWADSDFDGVGDNSDFAPHDSSETIDSDSDGVGDNSDPWPLDGSRKADRDGDGVADSADSFPDDPNRDSWTSTVISMMVIIAIVLVGLVVLKRSKEPPEPKELDWGENTPMEAPSFDSFE